MSRGIIVFGSMGIGKTTLGKELAAQLGYPFFDTDDYLWRRDTEIPYSEFHTKEDRIRSMLKDISPYSHFVLSGQMWSIRKAFAPLFELGVFITAPSEVCIERFRLREIGRWGDRVLPGGDMYENFMKYLNLVEEYDTGNPPAVCLKRDEQWIAELSCPVLRIDGTKPIAENATWIVEQYTAQIAK